VAVIEMLVLMVLDEIAVFTKLECPVVAASAPAQLPG
jgi:hypothetical protein